MSTGPTPPGPTGRAGPPPDRLPLLLLLSGLALFMAVVAAGISVFALSRSGDSAGVAAPTTATPVPSASVDGTPTGPGPTDATATTEPTEESTSEPTDGPDPAGVFTVAYQDEPLRLQPSSRYIDLDQPSGNAPSAASELQYSGFAPAFKFLFGNVSLASVNSPTATANDCALQLRRAPVDPEFAPEKGQLVCVLTDREAADNEGIRQKIVLLRVVSIGQDGTLNLALSAWTVPR